jgi:hypothetical protein
MLRGGGVEVERMMNANKHGGHAVAAAEREGLAYGGVTRDEWRWRRGPVAKRMPPLMTCAIAAVELVIA